MHEVATNCHEDVEEAAKKNAFSENRILSIPRWTLAMKVGGGKDYGKVVQLPVQ